MCQGQYNNFHRIFLYWVIPIRIIWNVVVITIVKNSGIAVTSSTRFLMMSRHKISPKFTQQGRIDFISKFTMSNNYESFDIVVLNYHSSKKCASKVQESQKYLG